MLGRCEVLWAAKLNILFLAASLPQTNTKQNKRKNPETQTKPNKTLWLIEETQLTPTPRSGFSLEEKQ